MNFSGCCRQQSFNRALEIKCEVDWFFDHVISITNGKQTFHAQLLFINISHDKILSPHLHSQLPAKTTKSNRGISLTNIFITEFVIHQSVLAWIWEKGEKKSLFYFKSGVLAVQSGCSHLPRLLFAGCVSRLLLRNLCNNSDAIDKEWQFILRLSTGQERNEWSIKFRGMNLFCIWFFH